MPSPTPPLAWHVVVPLKPLDTAKSRLAPLGPLRRTLASAMALDTLAVAVEVVGPGRVHVVGGHPEIERTGVDVVPDPGTTLDDAVRAGERAARAAGADAVAALVGDLPCLLPADLRAVLREASGHDRALVADADGRGTVLLTATRGVSLAPSFGVGSADRHRAHAVELTAPTRVRLDVDDAASWRRALDLGVGPHTLGAAG